MRRGRLTDARLAASRGTPPTPAPALALERLTDGAEKGLSP
jgi:hypothetical protein